MITLDTSGIVAALARDDHDHDVVRAALTADRGPYFVRATILAEVAYLLESRSRSAAPDVFLTDLAANAYILDCGENDLPEIRLLIQRYADLPLGFADAAVIACAERHGGRVLTLDNRHFGVVAREGRITIVP